MALDYADAKKPFLHCEVTVAAVACAAVGVEGYLEFFLASVLKTNHDMISVVLPVSHA